MGNYIDNNHFKSVKIKQTDGLNIHQYTLINSKNVLLPMMVKIKTAKNVEPMIFKNVLIVTASMDDTSKHTIYTIKCKDSSKIFCIESVDYCWWTITSMQE